MPEHFRRTDPRYDRRVEVELVFDGKKSSALTKNISLGGMYVETLDLIPADTTLQVRFRVPTQPEAVDVSGEVRWVDRGGPGKPNGIGIRFHGLRARDVWALNRFFQT